MSDDSSYEYDSASGDELSDCEFFASTAADGFGVRMLPTDELRPVMNDRIRKAAEVLGAPPVAAAIILREHEWEKERMFQSFFDDPDRVKEKCGVLARCRHSGDAGFNTRVTAKQRICEICMNEDGFEPDEMIGMPCGHEFCETCWHGFICSALDKGPRCVRETCPQVGCNELITEEEVRRAAPHLLSKFERYQLQSFVEMCGMARWCPGPGCGQVALNCGEGMFADVGGYAKCDVCNTCFCLKCGEEPHAPISCRHLSRWQEKCMKESETMNWNWIFVNTKACPKCFTRIEKNHGCNVSSV
jgi:ariadne-1